MKQIIYTVQAYHFGDKTADSYILGVYDERDLAIKAAVFEQQVMNNKYSCEVLELTMNVNAWDERMTCANIIKEAEGTL